MRGQKFGVIFVLSVCLAVFSPEMSGARPVDLADYFAVGEIGGNLDTVSQVWNYQYTSGSYMGQSFTVNLKGSVDPATGVQHRVYKKGDGSPYLECYIRPKSMSIVLAGTREGFNITDQEISRLNDRQVFHGTKYAWVLHFRRECPEPLPYKGTYLMIVVIDKTQNGDALLNGCSYLDIPSELQSRRVMGISFFAPKVGEIYHWEYSYDSNNDHKPSEDYTYKLISTSAPSP